MTFPPESEAEFISRDGRRGPAKDYSTAEGFMQLAFGHARKRNSGFKDGSIFTVEEQLLVAIYYLIRSRIPM